MKLPGTNKYASLQSSNISDHLIGTEVTSNMRESVSGVKYPAYALVYGDCMLLPHTLEAIMGLLDPEAEEKSYVYAAEQMTDSTLTNLTLLGAGDKYLLEDLLNDMIAGLSSGGMELYYTDNKDTPLRKIKPNSFIKLNL